MVIAAFFLHELVRRTYCISAMENDGFALSLMFRHSVVEISITTPKDVLYLWVTGGISSEVGRLLRRTGGVVGHRKLLGAGVMNAIYGKTSRGPWRKHGRGLPDENNVWGCVCIGRVVRAVR